MSIVAAHRLGALDDSNAEIEEVFTVDEAIAAKTTVATVATNSAKQPRFGRFV